MFHPGREGSVTHRLECEDAIKIAPHSSYMRSATHTAVSSSIGISLHLGYIPPSAGYIPQLKGNIAIFPIVLFLLYSST
jgi:hypothetical protein